MNTPMPIPSDKSEVVGSIVNRHITTNAENHYCCTWDTVKLYSSRYTAPQFTTRYSSSYESNEFKSPVFTVSNRDECKWYLSLQSNYNQINHEPVINCHLRLVLDRESECEEATAKFKLSILSTQKKHECNLDSSRTFQFVRKSENSAGILSAFDVSNCDACSQGLAIVCEMKIETSFPEVDSYKSDFGSLFKNQLFTDVALSVGEKKFPAHKVILTVRSSVFAAMFAHNMVENRGEVQIVDMSEDVVEEMLRFIYTGEVEKLNDLAPDLLMAADKYDLKGLRIKCEKVLIADLSSSNVFDMIAFANLHNATELKIKAMELFLKTGSEIKNTSGWKNLGPSDYELVKELCEALMQ